MDMKRLRSSSIANTSALALGILIQIVSVPLLSAAFGAETYGTWVMLMTIPVAMVLLDLGFHAAATSDMAMKHSAGKKNDCATVYFTITVITVVLAVTFSIIGIMSMYAVQLAVGSFSDDPRLPDALTVVILYSGAWLISGVPMAGLKGNGRFEFGVIGYQAIAFIESAVAIAIAHWGGALLAALTALCVVRSLGTILFFVVVRYLEPHLSFTGTKFSHDEARRLLPLGLAAASVPVALALSLQGTVLVAGLLLGPVAAAVYSTLRTASRFPLQAVSMINLSIAPELSRARGAKNALAELRCWKLNRQIIIFLLAPAAAVFAALGPWAVSLWSNGLFTVSYLLAALVTLTMFFHGVWYFRMQLLIAGHDHVGLGRIPLIVSLFALPLAAIATRYFGLEGAAAVTAVAELTIMSLILARGRQLNRLPS